jgi:hypothetical protein
MTSCEPVSLRVLSSYERYSLGLQSTEPYLELTFDGNKTAIFQTTLLTLHSRTANGKLLTPVALARLLNGLTRQDGVHMKKLRDTFNANETSGTTEISRLNKLRKSACHISKPSDGRSAKITWTPFRLTLLFLLVAWFTGCYWLLVPEH